MSAPSSPSARPPASSGWSARDLSTALSLRRAARARPPSPRPSRSAAARQERLDDVGVVRGRFRGAAAARPARNDARRRHERVEPVHVPDEDEEPGLPDAVQHGVPRHHRAGRRASPICALGGQSRDSRPRPRPASRGRWLRRGDDVFRLQHLPHRHRHRAHHAAAAHDGLEPELPVERAELLRRRRRRAGADLGGR